jgi:hypothetical protein
MGAGRIFGISEHNKPDFFLDNLYKSHVLISGELKNMSAPSFDKDFKAQGLTTISCEKRGTSPASHGSAR